MPNYCDAKIRVRGRRDCVDEFIKIVQADYCYQRVGSPNYQPKVQPPHFYRIFEADVLDAQTMDMLKYAELFIRCAWSVGVCMMSGPFTYYDDSHTEIFTKDYGPSYGTTLLRESERLHLDIEIFSSEPGMCFQEHYRIVNGILVDDECIDATFVYAYDLEDYEEFCELYPEQAKQYAPTEEAFKALRQRFPKGYIITTLHPEPIGLDKYTFPFSIPQNPRYLYLNVMCKRIR